MALIRLAFTFFLCLVVAFSYYSIYSMYTNQKHDRNGKLPKKLSENAKRLLLKFSVISGLFYALFLPAVGLFAYMLITSKDVPWTTYLPILVVFELSPAINPVLLYFLDARLRISVKEMFGISATESQRRSSAVRLSVVIAATPFSRSSAQKEAGIRKSNLNAPQRLSEI